MRTLFITVDTFVPDHGNRGEDHEDGEKDHHHQWFGDFQAAQLEEVLGDIGNQEGTGGINGDDGGDAENDGCFQVYITVFVFRESTNQGGSTDDEQGVGRGQYGINAEEIDQYWNSEDGSASPDETERETDKERCDVAKYFHDVDFVMQRCKE